MDSQLSDQLSLPSDPSAPSLVVLFQSVGTGSVNHPVWEALAFAVREIKPNILVQCCSTLTAQETIPLFDQALGDVDWAMEIARDVSDQPDDINDLAQRYTSLMEAYKAKYPDAEFHVDFTSGTKAMSVAIAVAGVLCEVSQTHYSIGDRDSGGRAVKTNVTVPFMTTDLIARHRLLELKELFNAGRYDLVSRACAKHIDYIQDPGLRVRLETLRAFSDGYAKWDQFEWRSARTILNNIRNKMEDKLVSTGWDIEQLDQNRFHVKVCEDSPFSFERVIDLYNKASRVYDRADFDEFALRCYRIVEYVGQYRFAYIFGCDTKSLNSVNSTGGILIDVLKQHVPRFFSNLPLYKTQSKSGKVKLGLAETLEVLGEIGDSYGLHTLALYHRPDGKPGPLKNGLESRNQSWLAHGSNRVNETNASEMRTITKELIEFHLSAPIQALAGDRVEVGSKSFDEYVRAATFLACPAWFN